jgi:uncharacterized repeat protein (TIGR03847 family)
MSVFYEFDEVDAFTVGALGQPGARTFLLQIRHGSTRVTIKCEKQQAAAIADYLGKVLADAPMSGSRPIPAAMELIEPVEAAFTLGPIGLGFDRSNNMVLLQLEEVIEVDEDGQPVDDNDNRGHVRVLITPAQAAAFSEHAESVVAAGRPNCVFCGGPINSDGHACPRMN